MADETPRDPARLSSALRLVLRRYLAQVRQRPLLSAAALVLPGLGNLLIFYGPPLVVARMLGAVARGEALTTSALWPYVATLAGLWLSGEIVWRFAGFTLARA